MSEELEKPLWLWIARLVIGLPVLYVLSFGPACWITSRADVGASTISVVYRPITSLMLRNEGVALAMESYAQVGAAGLWRWERRNEPADTTLLWTSYIIFTGNSTSLSHP